MRSYLEDGGTIEVIAEAADGHTLLDQVKALRPDVVVADISMPELNGINATRAIQSLDRAIRVLIVSVQCTESALMDSLAAGANGYVLKEAAADELRKAVEAVGGGQAYFSPAVAKLLADATGRNRPGTRPRLSAREREVVQLIAEGSASREIAKRLFVSTHTIKSHRANAMRKLDCRTTADLVRYAIAHGLAH